MYFYYFLGWELEARDDLSRAQKDKRAENTFCLALGKILHKQKKWFCLIEIFIPIIKIIIAK